MNHHDAKDLDAKVGETVQINVETVIQHLSKEFNPLYVIIPTIVLVISIVYWIFFTPLNRVRDMTEVGYSYLKKQAKSRRIRLRDLVNEVRARRKVGDLPPVYPNGWFALVESRDLKPGAVKPLDALGENFVVFRTHEGSAYILDAYCPHLGANLGIGGRIIGNCIECPFHGWQFDGRDGVCTKIPYAEKVPSIAKTKKWPVFEANGFIYVWYHAEGVEPTWYPSVIAEIDEHRWRYGGRSEHYVNVLIEDISENGSDVAHLPQVHRAAIMGGVNINKMRTRLWSFAEHVWDASWEECPPPNEHISKLCIKHTMKLFGKLAVLNINVLVHQIGPSLVHLHMDTFFGKGILIQTVLPLESLELRIVHQFYCTPYMPHFYSKLLLLGEAIMIERDITVWNSKTYISKPLLVKEDRLLAKHRRWYSQFFTENSRKFTFAKKGMDW